MNILIHLIIFIFGLAVGSFLNVVISRLDSGKPMFFSRSECPKCGKVLKWYELIPVVSFLIQLGKCRNCGKKISWQYPLVEITTGLLFLLIFNFYGNLLVTSYLLLVTCFLLVVFVYDLKHYIIPDKIVFPAIAVSFIWIFISGFILNTKYEILDAIFSALGASLFFLVLVLITKGEGMGLGDVKLVFLMGLILGWPEIFAAIFLAVTLGALAGGFLILLKRKSLKSQIPFGPFLAGSTIFIIIFGDFVIKYLSVLDLFFLF